MELLVQLIVVQVSALDPWENIVPVEEDLPSELRGSYVPDAPVTGEEVNQIREGEKRHDCADDVVEQPRCYRVDLGHNVAAGRGEEHRGDMGFPILAQLCVRHVPEVSCERVYDTGTNHQGPREVCASEGRGL